MVETLAFAAVSLFIVGLIVGLLTTAALGRDLKQTTTSTVNPSYRKRPLRR
jgi:hypothetical protein